ncbi:MAG: response regulator transcription factor [Defluviitaleaceae bacterium]|nr:response regulator transcription factor [Defluviitaleaceae bacterium]
MLDIYVCEDNAKQLAFMAGFISDYCAAGNLDAALVLASPSPAEVLAKYKDTNNAALFVLDISLKADLHGLELASRIREQGKKAFIVFVTVHPELTLLTFQYKVEAMDFIVKDHPDNIKRRIGECIDIALKRHKGPAAAKTLQISIGDEVIQLDMAEIIHIETTCTRHKLRLYTKSRILEFNGDLKTIETRLDERFIRCHRSFIINRDKIAVVNKKANTVTMVNNSVCSVSRNRKNLLVMG